MAPNYKLTYYNATNLAEPIRLLLTYGDLEFEDVRLSSTADLSAAKETSPNGKLPILEYNGKVAYESVAICRYLANQLNLVGRDEFENLDIDAAVESIQDIATRLALYHDTKIESEKEMFRKQVFDDFLPQHLKKLDAQAKANNGHFATGKLTWADIYFVGLLDYIKYMAQQDIFFIFPNLQAVKKNVLAIPSIKAWFNK